MRNKFIVLSISLILLFSVLSDCFIVSAEGTKGSNIVVDYRKILAFETDVAYTGYLRELLDGLKGETPSDAAKAELALYIETAISALASVKLEAVANRLIISGDNLTAGIAAAEALNADFESLLDSFGIVINKTLSKNLRIDSTGFNLAEPCQVTFSADIPDVMNASQNIRLLLDDSHGISVTADSLKSIISNNGVLIIQFQRTDFHEYKISFVNNDGVLIDKLAENVDFSLPADSALATILVDYLGGSDNWGGQYDSSNGVIDFSTRYSGHYEVLESTVNIFDISGLSEEAQAIVTFMVSKGYFTSSGNNFEPNQLLSRYDFTAALVKMFFALDRETQSSFTDVPQGSAYYAYVSSAKADNIVKGADSSMFKGDLSISKVEVIALCARTLAEKKGYSYPENISDYLQFSDKDKIEAWALSDVALAVREGLIPSDGALDPNGNLSRTDSALILYKLFMLLYETSPISFNDITGANAPALVSNDAQAAAEDTGISFQTVMNALVKVLLVLAIVGFVICILLLLGKKQKKK